MRKDSMIITTPNLQSLDRIRIYIDGANFYHGIQAFNKRYQDFFINFNKLGQIIAGTRRLNGINYYIAPYPRTKNEQIFQKQNKFFARLKQNNIQLVKSNINPESNKIKGDDIQIAIDMLDDAVRDRFDTGILLSGDGDFVPLVRRLQVWQKKVELWYFEGQTAQRLKHACDLLQMISRSLVRRCYIPYL